MRADLQAWLTQAEDPGIREELLAAASDPAAVGERFDGELSFGTGGLRGVMGAGPCRMNLYTVGRATFGVADYLKSLSDAPSAVIAFDTRKNSPLFARRAAEILSSQGITVRLFPGPVPTPVLSFAVRFFKADLGIVITASHNPRAYNGYKVYNARGCQITEEAAAEITKRIRTFDYFCPFTPDPGRILMADGEVREAFLRAVRALSLYDPGEGERPSVVYTPLHGTGMGFVPDILAGKAGQVRVVAEQQAPDGDFPTCPYPNPERPEAMALAVREAERQGADLVLATDPDADRLGAAVRGEGEYVLLNGNETGCLLLFYLLERKRELGLLGKDPTVVKTIVTSDLVTEIAGEFGVCVREVLTGFKYIGEEMDKIPNFIMGLEESCGYLVGRHVRDKDAVSAAMMLTEACAWFRSRGKTPLQVLGELSERFGFFRTALFSLSAEGADGAARMAAVMKKIRGEDLPLGLKGFVRTDYQKGLNGLPASDVIQFRSGREKITLRPSGTEPKLKLYFQTKAGTAREAEARLTELSALVMNAVRKSFK